MIKVIYTASFIRELKRVGQRDKQLYEEVLEKMEFFKDRKNHKRLRVHKLHGRLANYLSFSINYRFRIVFEFKAKNTCVLHDIGDHEIYR